MLAALLTFPSAQAFKISAGIAMSLAEPYCRPLINLFHHRKSQPGQIITARIMARCAAGNGGKIAKAAK